MSNNNQAFDILSIASLYTPAAERAAVAQGLLNQARKEASKQGKGVWGAGLQAVEIACKNGHNAATMLTLFGIALSQAGVPEGTFKGYQSDLKAIREEIETGKHPHTGEETGFKLADALMLSRAEARKRYRVVTAEEAAKEALATLTKEWDADNLQALLSYARKLAGEETEESEEATVATLQEAVAA